MVEHHDPYDYIRWLMDGRTLLNVIHFSVLTDGNKVILLFGEKHKKEKTHRGTISFSKLMKDMISREYCPSLDILVESEMELLSKMDLNLSVSDVLEQRAETGANRRLDPMESDGVRRIPVGDRRSLSTLKYNKGTINKLRKIIADVKTGKIQLPEECHLRLHYIDQRDTLGMSFTWIPKLLTDSSPECVNTVCKTYLYTVAIPIFRRIQYTLQSIALDDIPSSFSTLIKKQISKMDNRYKPGLRTTINMLARHSGNHVIDYLQYQFEMMVHLTYADKIAPGDKLDELKKIHLQIGTVVVRIIDIYVLSRILKSSSDLRYMRNVVVYMGSFHTGNLYTLLTTVFGFKSLVNVTTNLNRGVKFPPYRYTRSRTPASRWRE